MTENQQTPPSAELPHELPHEPARNQFGLRGMFLLMTAICLILGAISWAGINQPRELLGALALVIFCAVTIGVIEFFQRLLARPVAVRRSPLEKLAQSPFAESPFRDETLPITAEVIEVLPDCEQTLLQPDATNSTIALGP